MRIRCHACTCSPRLQASPRRDMAATRPRAPGCCRGRRDRGLCRGGPRRGHCHLGSRCRGQSGRLHFRRRGCDRRICSGARLSCLRRSAQLHATKVNNTTPGRRESHTEGVMVFRFPLATVRRAYCACLGPTLHARHLPEDRVALARNGVAAAKINWLDHARRITTSGDIPAEAIPGLAAMVARANIPTPTVTTSHKRP
jgi:hypothetical protein